MTRVVPYTYVWLCLWAIRFVGHTMFVSGEIWVRLVRQCLSYMHLVRCIGCFVCPPRFCVLYCMAEPVVRLIRRVDFIAATVHHCKRTMSYYFTSYILVTQIGSTYWPVPFNKSQYSEGGIGHPDTSLIDLRS